MDIKADAECQLNKSEDNIIQVCHESGMLYFRPETEEIIVVPEEDAGDFETHCLDMLGRVDEFHQANHAYSAAVEKYGLQRQQAGVDNDSLDSLFKNVTDAEKHLNVKREALLGKLRNKEPSNNEEPSNMGYQDVVELLPLLDTRRRGTGNQRLGRRYVYARKSYYSERSGGRSQTGSKKTWRTVSLKNKDTATGKESIYTVDSHGRRKIDTQKLTGQLTSISPKLKFDLKDYVDLDNYNVDKTLSDWAESWNKSLEVDHSFNNGVDVSGAAQFMRFVSNVGAEAEFNPSEGNVKVKGEAKGSLSIASGVCSAEFFIPDRLGWDLTYTPEKDADNNTAEQTPGFSLGVVRIYIENQLIGFVGASAQIEAQLQVMVKDNEQQIVAGHRGQLPRFQERQSGSSAQFYQQMKKEDEGISVSVDVFAGASVEYSLKGAVQWLKPTPPSSNPSGNSHDVPKTAGEFTDLATIGASISGLAGIGAGAKFLCEFINGKFCFKVAASLCCGTGAKGAFLCEVGGKALTEFGSWLAYQLFILDYHFFDLVKEEAFETFTKICVMRIADLTKDIYEEYNKLKESVLSVGEKFDSFIESILDTYKSNIEASQKRNQLAANIITNPEILLTFTPEAKGILLYLLTRHGTWDHFDPENYGPGLLPDIYHDRKEAVIQVLNSIQTRREWIKVMCHRSQDGSDLTQGDKNSEEKVTEEQKRQLTEFLQEGFNRDQELSEIYNRLKTGQQLSRGYALAMNNTWE
ncbi:TPA: ATPase, partial [Escherichia coli]|nr:ATPase [Escherichia coli]